MDRLKFTNSWIKVLLILGWALSANPAASSEIRCEFVLSELQLSKAAQNRIAAPAAKKSETDFQALKDSMKQLIQAQIDQKPQISEIEIQDSALKLSSKTEKLAFFEAFAEVQGIDFLKIQQGTDGQAKKAQLLYLGLLKSLDDFEKGQPTTGLEVMHFVEQAYALTHSPKKGWAWFLGPRYQQDILDRVKNIESAYKDLSQVLQGLGLIREKSMLERLGWWLRPLGIAGNLLQDAGISFVTMKFFGTFMVAPTSLVRAEDVRGQSDEQLQARTQALKRKIPAFVDKATDVSLRVMTTLTLVSFLHSAALAGDFNPATLAHDVQITIQQTEQLAHLVNGEVRLNLFGDTAAKPDPRFEQSLHTEVYKVWAEDYAAKYGHPPDPRHELSDRALWVDFVQGNTN
jgi:hypothetical protein